MIDQLRMAKALITPQIRYRKLADIEKEVIVKRFMDFNCNISASARSLGLARETMRRKLREYDLL